MAFSGLKQPLKAGERPKPLAFQPFGLSARNLELVRFGLPLSLQPVVWGALSGALTGLLTNPPDLILSKLLTEKAQQSEESVLQAFLRTSKAIYEEPND